MGDLKTQNGRACENRLLGFRSGKWYKMIPAILYLFFMMLALIVVVFSVPEYAISPKDKTVYILHSFLVWLVFFAPYILLSFGLNKKLPLLREGKGLTFLGIIIVCSVLSIAAAVVGEMHTEQYRQAYSVYQEQQKEETAAEVASDAQQKEENNANVASDAQQKEENNAK